MARRKLYLIAYDISDARRLRHALELTRAYSTGGQKSVHECYLNDSERQHMLDAITQIIDPEEDRGMLLRLDSRCGVDVMGIANKPVDQDFFYVG